MTDSTTTASVNGGSEPAKPIAGSRRIRSRITNGKTLLPGVPSQSGWARMLRDLNELMVEHVGGQDYASEPQKLTCRRIAVLETELRHMEVRIAQMRAAGNAPDDALLDLYARLGNSQKRHIELIGLHRVPKDVTPSLSEYLKSKEIIS